MTDEDFQKLLSDAGLTEDDRAAMHFREHGNFKNSAAKLCQVGGECCQDRKTVCPPGRHAHLPGQHPHKAWCAQGKGHKMARLAGISRR